MSDPITIALPSKGAIAEPTLNFLSECGLRVNKPNPRQYTGSIPALPGVDVLFQRVKDVVYKVSDGTAQLGITGLDVVREHPHDDLIVVHPDLDYGHCKLLVAVPESWVDVENMGDLIDVALDFREHSHRNIRIATTYTNLARQFLHANGIHYFSLVNAEGAIEAAPTIGYADAIIDLVQTGTTLRENHLKPLPDAIIVESQVCIIGNREALLKRPEVLDATRRLLEYVDAALQGRSFSQITINMCGADAEEVARKVADNPLTRGLQGPTIAPIYGGGDNTQWFAVTIIIPSNDLLPAIEYLRTIGGTQAVAIPARYVFLEQSATFAQLRETLNS
jgi:ATP phosphoribosyltransferase